MISHKWRSYSKSKKALVNWENKNIPLFDGAAKDSLKERNSSPSIVQASMTVHIGGIIVHLNVSAAEDREGICVMERTAKTWIDPITTGTISDDANTSIFVAD